MTTRPNLDEFIPKMDTPEAVYQLFASLGYKVLDSHLKTNPSVYNLPDKEAQLVEKIFAIANYDRRFQILLFKLKEDSKEAVRTIPEKILREVDYPFIIFTPDYKTYTFALVEKVREGPGQFKRKLTRLIVDRSQPYHTDKEILESLLLPEVVVNPVDIYKVFQSAFSVEKVTKKFFTEYREVFEQLVREVIKQNPHLKFTLFSREGSVENFVKILLGRLMFLYFIQKRGWLNCFDGWGSGDKRFLFNKFQEAKKEKKTYYNDYLEPLFFDTLNNPRRDKPDQATMFGGRIPFLNGGLFEPEYDYKDVSNRIFLNNQTFEAVFSVFEKYNFTVKEDEPLDKEVAIDPEMLGKVFENLLEENLRKGKGTYYTPREIVHYMCHESLVNYLSSEVDIGQQEVREFLDREQSLDKKEALSPAIREKAKMIDEKLADIKVLDPACGSGAFLVGMLHEIINARLSLNRELGRSLSEYELKKETIQNNVYGVDIDPGAAEIAKLRLWLSLVVDHNLSEIEPLPNLDYKIMVGNSLLDEFMGVKLFDYDLIKGNSGEKKMKNLFEEESQMTLLEVNDKKSTVLKELQRLQQLYFKEFDPVKKKQIKGEIDKIEFDFIEATVKDELSKIEAQTKNIADLYLSKGFGIPEEESKRISKLSSKQAQILATFNEIKKSNVKPFFLFQLNFSDVFERKGGFDIVIANPPYMKERDNKKVFEIVNNSGFGNKYHQGKMDFWYYFLHKAIDLVRDDGLICYITSRYWLNSLGAQKLIERVKVELSFINLVDIGDLKVFENVVGQHMIALYRKNKLVKNFVYKKLENDLSDLSKNSNTDNLLISILSNEDIFSDHQIVFESDPLIYKDVLTLGEISEVVQGLVQNPDKVSKKIAKLYHLTAGEGVFVLREDEINRIKMNKEERKFVVDFYDENDIRRYIVYSKNKKFLLYLTKSNCPDISIYPDIAAHLVKYKKIMDARRETKKGSNKWFHLHWPREDKYFESHKIVVPGMFDNVRAGYQEQSGYFGLSTNVITSKNPDYNLKFMLAILNSTFANYWFHKHGKKRGVGVDIGVDKLRNFPIRKCTPQEQKQFIEVIEEILVITNSSDYFINSDEQARVKVYEKQIDQMVYKLYGLTPEEIEVVEGLDNK